MTEFDFQQLGLTEEQWNLIRELAQSLSPDQALRLSGYFAGMDTLVTTRGGRKAIEIVRTSDGKENHVIAAEKIAPHSQQQSTEA